MAVSKIYQASIANADWTGLHQEKDRYSVLPLWD